MFQTHSSVTIDKDLDTREKNATDLVCKRCRESRTDCINSEQL